MSDDPFERAKAAFDDIGERFDGYVEVWKVAIERNGNNDYAADDFMVDLQKLWGMSLRDTVTAGAVVVDLVASVLAREPEQPPASP